MTPEPFPLDGVSAAGTTGGLGCAGALVAAGGIGTAVGSTFPPIQAKLAANINAMNANNVRYCFIIFAFPILHYGYFSQGYLRNLDWGRYPGDSGSFRCFLQTNTILSCESLSGRAMI